MTSTTAFVSSFTDYVTITVYVTEGGSTASATTSPTSGASTTTSSTASASNSLCPTFNGQQYTDGQGVPYDIFCNREYSGTTLGLVTKRDVSKRQGDTITVDTFLAACDANAQCIAITVANNECRLFSSVNGYFTVTGSTAAIKVNPQTSSASTNTGLVSTITQILSAVTTQTATATSTDSEALSTLSSVLTTATSDVPTTIFTTVPATVTISSVSTISNLVSGSPTTAITTFMTVTQTQVGTAIPTALPDDTALLLQIEELILLGKLSVMDTLDDLIGKFNDRGQYSSAQAAVHRMGFWSVHGGSTIKEVVSSVQRGIPGAHSAADTGNTDATPTAYTGNTGASPAANTGSEGGNYHGFLGNHHGFFRGWGGW
ncbi:hypothetical protein EJ03DRAFT_352313 [Teratosphaeria nubilosa]|uniref:Uncharacterized protein n=1 Tax=Teratosphaeria nubilosa TaxID=161662 RepID=A0A6G1L5W6_9PEZI|nr:hypothetical protein EJ03DRAFT_352313 [Teratosphaeria nubilosa]